METIAISIFKATCLGLLEKVRKKGEPLLVTRRGTPVAQILPPPALKALEESAFGCMKGTAEIVGDVVEPLPPRAWGDLR